MGTSDIAIGFGAPALHANMSRGGGTDPEADAYLARMRTLADHVFSQLDERFKDESLAAELCEQTISSGFEFLTMQANEVKLMACGEYTRLAIGKTTFDGADVLTLTDRFAGSPMPVTTLYKTLDGLVTKGLLTEVGLAISPKTGRAATQYIVNEQGQRALKLAVIASHHLHQSRLSKVA
jgi:hypothetical protein